MPTEIDLPCPDCGVPLYDRTVEADALPGPSSSDDPVPVAECPGCDARFYPDRTLARLFPDVEGGNEGDA